MKTLELLPHEQGLLTGDITTLVRPMEPQPPEWVDELIWSPTKKKWFCLPRIATGSAPPLASDYWTPLCPFGEAGDVLETSSDFDAWVDYKLQGHTHCYACRKGLWSVESPDCAAARHQAAHYHMQYAHDGEYGDRFAVLTSEAKKLREVEEEPEWEWLIYQWPDLFPKHPATWVWVAELRKEQNGNYEIRNRKILSAFWR